MSCEGHYNSSKSYWSLPADLFHVNRHISIMSEEVFFSCNQFIVDVRLGTCYPADPLLAWQIGRMKYSLGFGALIIPDFFAQFLRDAYQNYGLLHGDTGRISCGSS